MSKLDEMLARKIMLKTKINGIQIAVKKDYIQVGNSEMKIVYRSGKDAEYDLLLDMFALANRNTQIELKEIDAKIAAINELLGE